MPKKRSTQSGSNSVTAKLISKINKFGQNTINNNSSSFDQANDQNPRNFGYDDDDDEVFVLSAKQKQQLQRNEYLESLTKEQLKIEAKRRGQKTAGTKTELVNFLLFPSPFSHNHVFLICPALCVLLAPHLELANESIFSVAFFCFAIFRAIMCFLRRGGCDVALVKASSFDQVWFTFTIWIVDRVNQRRICVCFTWFKLSFDRPRNPVFLPPHCQPALNQLFHRTHFTINSVNVCA